MANLDGFILTHTYEIIDVPTKEQAHAFLKPFETKHKMEPNYPRNLSFTVGPAFDYC